jgi:DNA polymerase III alpha subunit
MKDFPNFVTCHSHPGSLDTASTPAAFIKREQELGTGAITATDHGTLGQCPAVYKLARKAKLTPILGLEAYFRDDDCPILRDAGIEKTPVTERQKDGTERVIANTYAEYNKYYHATLHTLDQEAYETLCRVLSKAGERAERHGSERKPIFNWADMEELGSKNITVGSSCLIGMVQRHLLAHRPDIAVKYYEALRKLVKPGNFIVEVFPHRCTHYWVKGVFIKCAGQEKPLRYWKGKTLRVDVAGEVMELAAEALAKKWASVDIAKIPVAKLLAQKDYRTWADLPEPLTILDVHAVEDYIENECTKMSPDGDVQLGANRFMLWMAKKHGDPVLVSDDSHFAFPEDKPVQDIRLLSSGTWRFFGSYHRQSSDEAFRYFKQFLGTSESQFEAWVQNSRDWAKRFGWEWKPRRQLPTKFYPEDTLAHTMALIRKVGRMDWKNKVWVKRLTSEIQMLHRNGTIDLLPYFFIDHDVVDLYERNGQLTGTGRGSAAGLLLAYLLGITHVDPLKYQLSKERFLTESRIRSGKLPDIDQDLPDRNLLINEKEIGKGWLYERFRDHFAQVSNDTRLRLASSIKDVHRVLDGQVSKEIERLTGKLAKPPQGIEDHDFVFGYKGADGQPVKGSIETDPALKQYATKYPQHWAIVQKCLGITRQKSKHACAFVITNEPVTNFLPTMFVGDDGVPVTQYTKDWVEEVGGLKMDFLEVTSLLNIQGAVRLIQKSCGYDPKEERINGLRVPAIRVVPKFVEGGMALYDVWDLPEDQDVFAEMCAGRTETCFQFDTPAVRQWLELFMVNGRHTLTSVEHLSAFTALDRPGPLDATVSADGIERNMLEEFAARARGETPIGANPHLDRMFPETHGVIVYQEQLQKAFQEFGQTSAEAGDEFRVHVSKKKMSEIAKDREVFMPGAIKTLGSEEEAERIWGMLFTFGQYGFNHSHSVCYALTGYVGAWLKHHYPTEWWTSVLQNADRTKIDNRFWEFCGSYVDMPDIKLSEEDFAIQNDRIRAPLRLLSGMGASAHDELMECRPFADLREFCQKVYDRRVRLGSTVIDKKLNKKTGETTEVKKVKLARSALNRTVLSKLIVSGVADSLFPDDCRDIYSKLTMFNQVKAEVEGKKPEQVDARFLNLSPLQRFQLRKDVLSSFTTDLVPMVAEVLDKDEFRAERGYRNSWKMPRPFDENEWCPVVHGKVARQILEDDGPLEGISPKFKFGVVAYISDIEWFWNGKAARVHFDVNGERFNAPRWPNYHEKQENKGAKLPDTIKGAVVILTLARWSEEKQFSVDDIRIIEPGLTLKPAAAAEQSAE